MSDLLTRLRDRRQSLWTEAQQINERALQEERDLDGPEEESFESLKEQVARLDQRIHDLSEAETRDATTRAAFEKLERQPAVVETAKPQDGVMSTSEQLRSFLRGENGAPRYMNVKSDKPVDFRSLTKLTAGAGANTVSTSFYERLVAHMIETSALLRAGVTILNTAGGETLQVPKTTSHSTGAIVAEAGTIGVSDPAFGQVALGAYKYGVMVQVSRELLDDTGIDLEGYLSMQAGRAIGNALGSHLVVGTGTNQPRGVITDATVGVTGATTVSGAFNYDNLVDLFYSVIAPYRNSAQAAWLVNDSAMAALRKMKDTTGQPIFQPSMVAGTPDVLFGKPIYTDPYVPAVGLNAKSVVFGDLSQFFVRLAGGIRFERSDDYAFNSDLVTYRALLRGDSALVDTSGAVKVFQGAAT
jgi:HK97 family phage major capsid protein